MHKWLKKFAFDSVVMSDWIELLTSDIPILASIVLMRYTAPGIKNIPDEQLKQNSWNLFISFCKLVMISGSKEIFLEQLEILKKFSNVFVLVDKLKTGSAAVLETIASCLQVTHYKICLRPKWLSAKIEI